MQGRSSIAWPICSARLHIRSSSGHATRHATRESSGGHGDERGRRNRKASLRFVYCPSRRRITVDFIGERTLPWHYATLLGTRVSYAAGFMAGSSKLGDERESFVADEVDPDEPSPYDSDTEEIDLDAFIKTLSYDLNHWRTYRVECFNFEKIADGFFGEIFKVKCWRRGAKFVQCPCGFVWHETCERYYSNFCTRAASP